MSAIKVKYEDGVFRPLHRVRSVKEGAIGEVRLEEEQRLAKRVSVGLPSFSDYGKIGKT